jgi:thiamine kinase-like enzyme
LPGLDQEAVGGAVVEALPGLTNRSVRVVAGGHAYVVRLADPGRALGVDRAAEAHNAVLAWRLGVGPEVVLAEPDRGVLVTRYLDGAQRADANQMRSLDGVVAAARTLRRLHDSGAAFLGRTSVPDVIDGNRRALASSPMPIAAAIVVALQQAGALADALAAVPEVPVPCHGDPGPGNWLMRGSAGLLVDWEYSAMAPPTWDLAVLASEAEYASEDERRLLQTYLARAPRPSELARLAVMRALADLVAASWAVAASAGDEGRPEAAPDPTPLAAIAATRLAAYQRAASSRRLADAVDRLVPRP